MPLDENRDARSLSAASDTEEGEHLTWSADTLLQDLGIEVKNKLNSSGHYAENQERPERHDVLASKRTAWTMSQQGRASPVGHIPGLGHCDSAPDTSMSLTLIGLSSLLADTKSSTELESPCVDKGIDVNRRSRRILSTSPSLLGPPEEGDTAEHNTGTPQDTRQPPGGTWADGAATSNTEDKLKTVPMRGVMVNKGPAGTARAKGAASSGPLTVRSEIPQQPSGWSGNRASNPVTGPPASSTASVKTGHRTKRFGKPLPSLAKRGLVKRPVPFPRSQAGSSTGPRWQGENWRRRTPGRLPYDAIAGAFKHLISIMNATQTSINKPDHGDAVQILEGSPSVSTAVRSAIISLMKSLATAGDASELSGRSLWEPFGGAAHAKDPGNGGSISKSPQTRMEVFVRSLEASMNDVNRESCRRLGDAWGSPDISPEEWSRMRLDVGARLAESDLGTLTIAEALGLDTYHKKGCLRFESEGSKSTCCAHPDGEIAKSWCQTSTAGSSARGG